MAPHPGGGTTGGPQLFQYVFSRLLWLIPTILAMALVTFLVMHATPGSPLDPVAAPSDRRRGRVRLLFGNGWGESRS